MPLEPCICTLGKTIDRSLKTFHQGIQAPFTSCALPSHAEAFAAASWPCAAGGPLCHMCLRSMASASWHHIVRRMVLLHEQARPGIGRELGGVDMQVLIERSWDGA